MIISMMISLCTWGLAVYSVGVMGIWFSVPGAMWKARCLMMGMSRWWTIATWAHILYRDYKLRQLPQVMIFSITKRFIDWGFRTFLPSVLRSLRRSNRSRRILCQIKPKSRCLSPSWRPSWLCQTNSSSLCPPPKGWRWQNTIIMLNMYFKLDK